MLKSALTRMLALSRAQKRAIQLVLDAALLVLGYIAATRLAGVDLAAPGVIVGRGSGAFWLAAALFVPLSLAIFVRLGFYRAVVRYLSMRLLLTIFVGVQASAAVLLAAVLVAGSPGPLTIVPIYALIAMSGLGGMRMAMREILQLHGAGARRPVILYGAGRSGRQLLSSLREHPGYAPVAFLDDAAELHGSEIGGLQVHDPARLGRLIAAHGASLVLLAMPSASRAERRAVLTRLAAFPVRVQTVPGMSDILSGKARLSDLHDVAIEDLLGRDPVPPMEPLMKASIAGKTVMVTGAGGSIGSELCRQIIAQGPDALVLWDLSELALYTLHAELEDLVAARRLAVRLVPLMGSVQDHARLGAALARFGVQTIYHAAAYKHVPLVERNAIEGVRNNVFGTRILAEAAIDAGVEAVILVSSDKAVRPANIMGASKRLAELIFQAAALRQSRTVFSMVRFGNVLGSSGSVIPRFREQVARGGPVTVTDPDVTRYFMTIPEAAQLVIQAGAMARGGDVFVLDMGEPIRIVDLAERMVRLSGLTPYRLAAHGGGAPGPVEAEKENGDIAILFTGLRPGEKLFEELLIGGTARRTLHPRILTASESRLAPGKLDTLLDALMAACMAQDCARLRALMAAAPLGYAPAAPPFDAFGEAEGGRPLAAAE
ncbi:polysaccharide biosynthesis protein [Roseovarius aquimarinus]|uniref:Polysaccharide biosynthesis protein n=1 Tax=Roseovarius aquimarinus TaxID=1229156 RepID=A0ABW7I818_9RHOB